MTPFDSESLIETVERVEKQIAEPKQGCVCGHSRADHSSADYDLTFELCECLVRGCRCEGFTEPRIYPPISAERFAEMHRAHLESGTGVDR